MLTINDIPAHFRSAVAVKNKLRGALRRCRPATLARDGKAYVDGLTKTNDLMRLIRKQNELDRVYADYLGELTVDRGRAVSVARFHAHSIHARCDEGRACIAQTRGDVRITFPRALDGLTADGMVSAELLRLGVHDRLRVLSAGALLHTYQSALARADLRAYLEADAIESLVAGTAYRADGPEDLKLAKQLRERIDDVQSLRLPSRLPDYDALDAEVAMLDARADLLKLLPVDPSRDPQAAEAFERQQQDLIAAGAASDADDQKAERAS
jgi:hypothetical protein